MSSIQNRLFFPGEGNLKLLPHKSSSACERQVENKYDKSRCSTDHIWRQAQSELLRTKRGQSRPAYDGGQWFFRHSRQCEPRCHRNLRNVDETAWPEAGTMVFLNELHKGFLSLASASDCLHLPRVAVGKQSIRLRCRSGCTREADHVLHSGSKRSDGPGSRHLSES